MDFNNQEIFKGKTMSDLFKEIYNNSKSKEKQIGALIDQLKPMITEVGDAMMIVPLLKEYMELSIKNDEHLIKMASIVQRSMSNSNNDENTLLSDKDKEMLFQALHESTLPIKATA
jgi:hypothetical protein